MGSQECYFDILSLENAFFMYAILGMLLHYMESRECYFDVLDPVYADLIHGILEMLCYMDVLDPETAMESCKIDWCIFIYGKQLF